MDISQLEFAVQTFEATAITPILNDGSLTEMILAFEREQHFEPPGGYGGLIPANFNYGNLSAYFLGMFETNSYFAKMGCIYILACECGEVGCWPLTCTVKRERGRVRWAGFRQPHRPQRDYWQFGPFVFAEQLYLEALSRLEQELSLQRSR